jgi:uncharacterized protein HemX
VGLFAIFVRNAMQIKELEYFLDITSGKLVNSNDVNKAVKTLKLTMGLGI